MRAILRADDKSSSLWFEAGERFELPEFTDPEVRRARLDAGRKAARKAVKPPSPALAESTGPTDEGGPGAVARVRAAAATAPEPDGLDEPATDESPRVALRLLKPPPVPPVVGVAPDSLPPLGLLERGSNERERMDDDRVPSGVPKHFARIDDEMSTGLFEPFGWDEADPCSVEWQPGLEASKPIRAERPAPAKGRDTGDRTQPSAPPLAAPAAAPRKVAAASPPPAKAPPRAPWPTPAPLPGPAHRPSGAPHLTVVRRAEVVEDFSGLVATPLPTPPRPRTAEIALPAPRPTADVPDWYDDERNQTLVVVDPARRVRGAAPDQGAFWACVAMDLAAWTTGFAATFVASTIASTIALGVLVVTG
jgi:hypothetical protein